MTDQTQDQAALKAEMIRLATEQAWDEGKKCENCDGDGTVPGGQKVIHSQAGAFGADWDLEGVVEAIQSAREVQWADGSFMGHDLGVHTKNDRIVRFAVTRPQVEQTEAVK